MTSLNKFAMWFRLAGIFLIGMACGIWLRHVYVEPCPECPSPIACLPQPQEVSADCKIVGTFNTGGTWAHTILTEKCSTIELYRLGQQLCGDGEYNAYQFSQKIQCDAVKSVP